MSKGIRLKKKKNVVFFVKEGKSEENFRNMKVLFAWHRCRDM